jgi:hypothetical protein
LFDYLFWVQIICIKVIKQKHYVKKTGT